MRREQINIAVLLGRAAQLKGRPHSPAADKGIMDMVKGRILGTTPNGEASTSALFSAWQLGHEIKLLAGGGK